ncbi:hypothetical protein GYMLUDRAFT_250735 [Collybiopsis luxurians FD-317 M1]|uniref:Uncharacterized protein n=1 Tax=Collybiopsis luxurians FD-317 M1 TaxID=944289 RepID=A0A0D0BEL6_9AGAR|nr:hypothetical protein GYMLUDRAFT_250735 [Collybiopsis luxurians FD-317 M1]
MKLFTLISTISALLAAAIGVGAIAPDPDSVCRCPNNCEHQFGDSCAFYQDGNVINGACVNGNGGLTCAT